MNLHRPGGAGAPEPEDLAAYLDGELDPARSEEIRAWLAQHPEAARALEGQRCLGRLWQTTRPCEPADDRWPGVFSRIEQGVLRAREHRRTGFRDWVLVVTAVGALAAAVMLAFNLVRPDQTREAIPAPETPAFTVVSPEDIEITSMWAEDRDKLVIGAPPIDGPLEPVSPKDIRVEHIRPDSEGVMPLVETDKDGTFALVAAPLHLRRR